MIEAMEVRYKDMAILREALAYCANYGSPMVSNRARVALLRFADRVKEYCDHPTMSTLTHTGTKACLDCGARQI